MGEAPQERAATAEPDITVETREDLLYLLAEAAEIEHNLMCCYLYAAFSLRRGAGPGLTEAQARAVDGWRREIVSVAIEEMDHLALVANLATAIGGAPHFSRPNFPVQPGYHPSGVVVELARFCHETLDHFIYLERPEGVAMADGASFEPTLIYARTRAADRLMPSAQDYATVGHLYHALRLGLEAMSARVGEAALFCGDPAAQVAPPALTLPGLALVTDLASACAAVETIVSQGEGAPGHRDDSHYSRFLAMRAEYDRLQADDPAFDPAWPVARNPVMRQPPRPEGRVFVSHPEAARLLDFANALYGQMLRCLAGAYGRPEGDAAVKARLLDAAVGLMFELSPVAEHLATLPSGPEHPGVNAGVSFAMLRDVSRLPSGPGEARVLAERLRAIAERAAALFPAGHGLAAVPARLRRLAEPFATLPAAAVPATPLLPEKPPPAAGVEIIDGTGLSIHYHGERCIHARFCVLAAPTVFKANTPGAWIFPDTMPVAALVAVAQNCPSGAIGYARHDGGPDEPPPPVNTIHLRENGPYAVRAPLRLEGAEIGLRAALCRCGKSARKPFCDGSHIAAGFAASGEPATRPSQPLLVRDGKVEVQPQRNGPLRVTGNLEICAGTGRTVDRITESRLCRCGGSATKPFCDGTHARIGFQAA